MTRKQRIESLEYMQEYNLLIKDYHFTQSVEQMNIVVSGNLKDYQIKYLFNQRAIVRKKVDDKGNTWFKLSLVGEQKLKLLKGKEEYLNKKIK